MKTLKFFLLLSFVFCLTMQAQNPISVSNTAVAGAFPLATQQSAAVIVTDPAELEVVSVVAAAFKNDVKLITNVEPTLANAISTAKPVIIGTLNSSFIQQLVSAGKINASELQGKWETFLISVIDNPLPNVTQALVIAGSDPRGAAFGAFELSRMMGVSPWVWWADVIPEHKDAIYITQGKSIFGPPAVKYRGMFINDEDWGIQPWAAKNMDTNIRPNGRGDMGPNTYARIFEMMLRTKSNLMMPAMHSCTKAFWFYPQNPVMARRYQIVMSGSHCEMLLRNNEDEWRNNYVTEYGSNPPAYNWATSRNQLIRYWGDRIRESENTPALYPIGMRGIHDSGIEGYGDDNARKNALTDIIATQRSMLRDSLGKPINQIPQIFCPYKEVLPVYNLGLQVPEDATLLWPDDNIGYIRRLSNPTEQARSGGGGVYFHFSYWGTEQIDYLWLAATSPAHISSEMTKAYDLNCKTVWVFNVGDIKPAEFEYQFAMDLAWDVEKWRPANAHNYVTAWAKEIFGEILGTQIAAIKTQYLHLSASGRAEHVTWNTYTLKEMEDRIAAYDALAVQAVAVEAQIPARLQDAYYQLISYPVQAAAAMNRKILGAKLSFAYADRGREDDALEMALTAQQAYQKIIDLTYKYNNEIAGGKWNSMMSYAPRSHGYFYDPIVVDEEYIENITGKVELADSVVHFDANTYTTLNGNGKTIEVVPYLGIAEASLTVLPLDLTVYSAGNITSAPYVEYQLPVGRGENTIGVKCFPNFPIYTGKSLRYAISIDGSTPEFVTIGNGLGGGNALGESASWGVDMRRGYTLGSTSFTNETERNVTVRIYFAEPALIISGLQVTYPSENDFSSMLANPDFEDVTGMRLDGTVYRGDPPGWTRTGYLDGQSWGVNKDATNYHGQYVCWYNSTPMPADFELSQTVPDVPAGEYILRCKLGVPNGALTTQRMFAGNLVQYYGAETDYQNNLTAGETATFAGYAHDASNGTVTLHDMQLKVILSDTTDLKIGIRSSNKLKNGSSATSNQGWFKVDYFRLELVREYSMQGAIDRLQTLINEAQTLYNTTQEGAIDGYYSAAARATFNVAIATAIATHENTAATYEILNQAIDDLEAAIKAYKASKFSSTSYIINPSFEITTGMIQDGNVTFRGTPYGWHDTDGIIGNSFGSNNDASNISGTRCCWYHSKPMPDAFELYQELNGLPAGKYQLKCRLACELLTTQRIFANSNVQYFGKQSDYDQNLTAGETNAFANWTTAGFFLKEMVVECDLPADTTLRIGIRTSNQYANGNRETSTQAGWFKTDHFRLKLLELAPSAVTENVKGNALCKIISAKGGVFIQANEGETSEKISVYTLSGSLATRLTIDDNLTFISLPAGVYIIRIETDNYLSLQSATEKVIVR